MLIRLLIVALLTGCAPLVETPTPVAVGHPAPAMAPPPPPPPARAMPVLTLADTPIALAVGSSQSSQKTGTPKLSPNHANVRQLTPVVKADAISMQLKDATMAFDIPHFANVKNIVNAQLTIDPIKTVDELISSSSPTASVNQIQISKIVEVKLLAPDFKIIATSPDRQAMSEWEPTVWNWELSDAAPGKHEVHLSINAIVTIDGDRAERSLKTFEKTVVVEITPAQQLAGIVKQYWQWIWTTLLLPAGMWLWKRFKRE